MSETTVQQRLLEYVQRPNYRPVKPKVIAKKLELTEDQIGELRRAIRQLVKAGQLAYGEKHFVKFTGKPAPVNAGDAATSMEAPSDGEPAADTPKKKK
jgi:hypothetical protein